MKIEKISKIKDYRIFHDFLWPEDLPGFARFNLIYGWNGSGKTTLSSLFTYLEKKEAISDGKVQFQIDGNPVKGADIPNAVIPPVRVFNRDTVDRSIFEVPNHELPPVYYLGEDSIEKQKRIEELKVEQTEKNAEKQKLQSELKKAKDGIDAFCISSAAEIKNLLTSSGGGSYNNYNRSNFKNLVENCLADKESPCLSDEEHSRCIATKDGVAMREISLKKVSLPDYETLLNEVSQLLKKTVVSRTLVELVEHPDIANWVQDGLPLHTDKNITSTCHFCNQPISNERIEKIAAHFNDELISFQSDIKATIKKIEESKKIVMDLSFTDENFFYTHLQKEYKESISTWDTTKCSVMNFLDSLIKAMAEKKNQPFQIIDFDEFITISSNSDKDAGMPSKIFEVADATQNGTTALNKINTVIEEHNLYSQNFSEEVNETKKKLERHIVSSHAANYQEKKGEITRLNNVLAQVSSRLSEINTKIFDLEQGIRTHVQAADELNKEMVAYLGRDELHFEAKDNGYVISRNGQPAMHLSESERAAIVFIYFLKTLKDSGFEIKNGIVGIDDPISSLDANSMYNAFAFMKERTKNAKQVFVLTHNFSFFRLVRSWFSWEPGQKKKDINKRPSRFYMIEAKLDKEGRNADIGSLDPLLRNYESEYQYLFKKIYKEPQRNDGQQNLENYYGLPNIGRRLLESFLTFKLPHLAVNKLEKKLDEIEFEPVKKTRILRFLHVHSHYDQIGAPEHDLSLLSEASAIFVDLMDLIKAVDPEHYQGMVCLVENTKETNDDH